MLVNLNIIDLAVVKSLDLELKSGMSVLTGETGAGKSILLTALGLALGNRADSGIVRPGSKRAEINLEFDLSDAPLAQQWLSENELDNEGQCLIRRTISDDGRSKAYINNRSVTLQALQALSEKLIEIHGQHAHLTLLNPDEQRRLLDNYAKHQQLLLDEFGQNAALVDQVNSSFRSWQAVQTELSDLQKSIKERNERKELLAYQLEELSALNLEQFNYAVLSEEHSKQAHWGEILSSGHQQLDLLYENDRQSINQMLNQCIHELERLGRYSSDLTPLISTLNDAQIRIEESALELRNFLDAQEADPRYLEQLEQQLSIVHALSRKHQVSPEALPELAASITAELKTLSSDSARSNELKQEVKRLYDAYFNLAQALSERRRQSASELQKRISDMIKELGMPQGEFLVHVQPLEEDKPKLNGMDKIEFLVSANPGLPPKALSKVASGGELSRISLAIQVVASHDKTTPTMIFDEVDTGIGGGIAEIVGQKLRHLSSQRQILCVTHLPQVAAQANHHLYVSKINQQDVTSSTVRHLSEPERVDEIARMLGGVNITANTLAHAREMLTQAESIS